MCAEGVGSILIEGVRGRRLGPGRRQRINLENQEKKKEKHALIWFVSIPAKSPGPKSNSDTSVERDLSHRAASAYDANASVVSYSTGAGRVRPSPKSHSCHTCVVQALPSTSMKQLTSHRTPSSALLTSSSSLKYPTKSSFHCCVVILCPMNLCT